MSFQECFAIDHLHFSDVTPNALMPPIGPPDTPTPVQASSGQSGTTAGQHDIWSAHGAV